MYIPYTPKAKQNAKSLRREMTRQERHLWYDFLSTYPVRFNRQKPLDSFIADFYCHKAKLIIELDGSQHYTPEGQAYDQERSNMLESHSLLVLRFSNHDIDTNFDGVCQAIDATVRRTSNE